MRTIVFVLLATAITAGQALAQSRSDIGLDFVNRCVGALQSAYTTPEPGCACVLGHLSSRLNNRQLTIAARLMPRSGDTDALNAEILALRQQGYSAREIGAARAAMESTSATSEATCRHLLR